MTKRLAKIRAAALLAAASALSACATMAPKYKQPEAPVESALPFGESDDGAGAALLDWRSAIDNETLRGLIETALENNRDLRIATLNVERARALYRVQRADSFPTIDAQGAYSRQRIGENATTGTLGAGAARSEPVTIERFSASAGLSAYELDLFGRVRSLNRKALETYFATDDARNSAEISLVAEVANAYFQFIADRRLLSIARDTAESQKASLDLTRQLVDNGLGNDLDVQRAQTSVQRARADAAALEAQIGRDENALRLLLSVSELPDLSAAGSDGELAAPFAAPAGVSSEILLHRPDVLAAERRLKAANANIGAARAAFFPRILLTASAGTASAQLSDLFSGGTGVWSFAPSISVPIFTGGRNRAQLAGARIDRDIAVSEYEKAIQAAFRDVADALATRSTLDVRLDATEKLASAAAKTYELADARFQNGVDDYLAVLDAQRSDYAAKQELVLLRLEAAANAIGIYRAFGGVPVKPDASGN